MAKRHSIAVSAALATGLIYSLGYAVKFRAVNGLEDTAAIVGIVFGLVLNIALLLEILPYEPTDLGKIGHAKNTIVLSLILICCAAPFSLYKIFLKLFE